MTRGLVSWAASAGRRRPWLLMAAVAIVLAALVGLRGLGQEAEKAAPAMASVQAGAPLNDTAIEQWQIDLPTEEPPREAIVQAPVVNDPPSISRVDWEALAAGVADVSVDGRVPAATADLSSDMTPDQRQSIIADAESEAWKRGKGRATGIAVVGRGSPRGGGTCR